MPNKVTFPEISSPPVGSPAPATPFAQGRRWIPPATPDDSPVPGPAGMQRPATVLGYQSPATPPTQRPSTSLTATVFRPGTSPNMLPGTPQSELFTPLPGLSSTAPGGSFTPSRTGNTTRASTGVPRARTSDAWHHSKSRASDVPPSRDDMLELMAKLESKLAAEAQDADISERATYEQLCTDQIFDEAIQLSYVQCYEQGVLFERLRKQYANIFAMLKTDKTDVTGQLMAAQQQTTDAIETAKKVQEQKITEIAQIEKQYTALLDKTRRDFEVRFRQLQEAKEQTNAINRRLEERVSNLHLIFRHLKEDPVWDQLAHQRSSLRKRNRTLRRREYETAIYKAYMQDLSGLLGKHLKAHAALKKKMESHLGKQILDSNKSLIDDTNRILEALPDFDAQRLPYPFKTDLDDDDEEEEDESQRLDIRITSQGGAHMGTLTSHNSMASIGDLPALVTSERDALLALHGQRMEEERKMTDKLDDMMRTLLNIEKNDFTNRLLGDAKSNAVAAAKEQLRKLTEALTDDFPAVFAPMMAGASGSNSSSQAAISGPPAAAPANRQRRQNSSMKLATQKSGILVKPDASGEDPGTQLVSGIDKLDKAIVYISEKMRATNLAANETFKELELLKMERESMAKQSEEMDKQYETLLQEHRKVMEPVATADVACNTSVVGMMHKSTDVKGLPQPRESRSRGSVSRGSVKSTGLGDIPETTSTAESEPEVVVPPSQGDTGDLDARSEGKRTLKSTRQMSKRSIFSVADALKRSHILRLATRSSSSGKHATPPSKSRGWVLSTIRSLYNAKFFNDYRDDRVGQPRQLMPEFVYLWFLDKYPDRHTADESLWTFVRLLRTMSTLLPEVAQFAAFLDEQQPLEYASFFIYCRRLLLKFRVTDREIELVPLEQCFAAIDHVLSYASREQRDMVMRECKRRAIDTVMDAAVFMQVMMEAFKAEYTKMVAVARFMFEGVLAKTATFITFGEMSGVLKTLAQDAPNRQLLEIYRDYCMVVQASGEPDFESFLTVLNRRAFFASCVMNLPPLPTDASMATINQNSLSTVLYSKWFNFQPALDKSLSAISNDFPSLAAQIAMSRTHIDMDIPLSMNAPRCITSFRHLLETLHEQQVAVQETGLANVSVVEEELELLMKLVKLRNGDGVAKARPAKPASPEKGAKRKKAAAAAAAASAGTTGAAGGGTT